MLEWSVEPASAKEAFESRIRLPFTKPLRLSVTSGAKGRTNRTKPTTTTITFHLRHAQVLRRDRLKGLNVKTSVKVGVQKVRETCPQTQACSDIARETTIGSIRRFGHIGKPIRSNHFLTRFHHAVTTFQNYYTVRYMAGFKAPSVLQHNGTTGARRILR